MTWEIGKRSPHQAAANSGFSLLEMMISLGLISIIVGFFVVHLSFSNESSDLEPFKAQVERFVLQTSRSCNAFGEDRIITISKTELTDQSRKLSTPPKVRLYLKRPHESDFQFPESFQWMFYPGGLIEPLSIKLMNESSFVVMSFDPITGRSVTEN